MQEGMLFECLNSESELYHEQTCFYLDGYFNSELFKQTWIKVNNRFDIFKTVFVWKKVSNPVQLVLQEKDLDIYEEDISSLSKTEQEEYIEQFKTKDLQQPFDLKQGRLNRISFIKINPKRYYICWSHHHILLDGWSSSLVMRDFFNIYNCLLQGLPLPPMPVTQFGDYIKWLKKQDKNKGIQFWNSYLVGFTKFTGLPSLSLKEVNLDEQSRVVENNIILSEEVTEQIIQLCKSINITFNAFFQTAWGLLLQRYNDTDDSCFGMVVSGRNANVKNIEGIVGLFINTVPVRIIVKPDENLKSLLERVKNDLVKLQEYEYISLAEIMRTESVKDFTALFDSIMVFQNYPSVSLNTTDKGIEYNMTMDSLHSETNYSLTIAVTTGQQFALKFNYNTSSFATEWMQIIVNHFEKMITEMISKFDQKISELDILSAKEKHQLLVEFNSNRLDYPEDQTIVHLFEEQAENKPKNIALVFDQRKMTYDELNTKANQIARRLRAEGVKRNGIVGIIADKSFEMIMGVLGILKAGAGYLPIDCKSPQERITSIVEDSKLKIILTQKHHIKQVNLCDTIIDLDKPDLYKIDSSNLEPINSPEDLLYVIYTSGSTGKPKGVMIEHRNIVSLAYWFNQRYNFTINKRVLQLTNLSFGVAVEEILLPLIFGGTVYIPHQEMIFKKEKIYSFIKDNQIQIAQFVPVMLNEYLAEYPKIDSLNVVISGGDQLGDYLKNNLISKGYFLNNHYGTTETAIDALYHQCSEDLVMLGKPIANVNVYVLDRYSNLQPIGAEGELYAGGNCVGRGYVNNHGLTEASFIPNPYDSKERLYKTGDRVRMWSNGDIEYLGRSDFQVKIRGQRVEIGEIENQLLSHSQIRQVAVTDWEDQEGNKYLAGYFISSSSLSPAELKGFLKDKLPEYMIPSYFVQLEQMPLTRSEKINRRKLPQPDTSKDVDAELVGPRNEIEEQIMKLWLEILKIERIGIDDNFFKTGGHSINIISLSAKIHQTLDVEIPLNELFSSPTIRSIAEYIQKSDANQFMSIPVVEKKTYYQASSAQKRMYMLQQFNLNSTNYNIPMIIEIKGRLSLEKIEHVFNSLIRRHETLRTSFEIVENQVIQKINKEIDFKVDYVDHLDISEENLDKTIIRFIRPFDLKIAPLFRVRLLRLEKDKHLLMLDIHHIISDGVSMNILVEEFTKIYQGRELEDLRIQYKDFAEWQNNLLNSDVMKEQKQYWLKCFEDQVPVLNMPTDFPRPTVHSREGDYIEFNIDRSLTGALKEIARKTDSTMYMVLLSAVNILLSKYSGQEDIVVGSIITGRPHADLEKVIGMFVNTIPMRNYPVGEKCYNEFLDEVRRNALAAYENQNYQFEELVEQLEIDRDMSRNPIFDIMFVMQNVSDKIIDFTELQFKQHKFSNNTSKFDLTLSASELDEELRFNLEYSTDLFERDTIGRLISHFEIILGTIVADISIRLEEIGMVAEEEKIKIFQQFNNTDADYPLDKTIHRLFEEQVERTPDKTAVVLADESLTYRELSNKANQLARRLQIKGITSESICALLMERSLTMIISIFAIIKSGGAYLPIDPTYPKDRIRFTLEDSKAKIILTDSALKNQFNFSVEVICVDQNDIYQGETSNLEFKTFPENLAYIIYTSGTTGRPKGVMIEHRNVVRLLFNDKMQFDFSDRDIWTLFHSICFDFSVWEMYGALLYGGKLIIVPKLIAQNTPKFLNLLKIHKVTVLNQTPSAFDLLSKQEMECEDQDLSLRYIIFGGEALKPNMLKEWNEKYPETKLINMYGITETTVHVTFKEISKHEIERNLSSIGKPIPTLKTYIMDKNMRIQPIGVPGELCVIGKGVARGYLNRPELSAEKFVVNPLDNQERLYRSGDLARILENGELEYLGRIDHQVKIRGFRIELAEIENQLIEHDSVKDVIVITKQGTSNDQFLCAYLIASKELTTQDLRVYLSQKLPEYMIPAYFVQLDSFPLTANGKLNRKMLPEPVDNINIGNDYVPPTNHTEEQLAQIWSETLGVEQVGIYDDFFELGGHSLKATLLAGKILQELKVEIPLVQIFNFSILKELADYIQSSNTSIYDSIKKTEEKEFYLSSSAQKRMYILQQLDLENTRYNIPIVLEVNGKMDIAKLKQACYQLIQRHETLRTSFETMEEKIIQKVHKKVNFEIEHITKSTEESLEELIQDSIRPFDLSKTPLFRVKVIELKEEKYILIFDIHHILSDGLSMGILIEEFFLIYQGEKLSELRIQYKDYAQWQNNLFESAEMKEQEQYWLERFSDELLPLNLPTDYNRPVIKRFQGDSISFRLGSRFTDKLKEIAHETGSTMYMVLLTAMNILLAKYSGQNDITIGSPVAGRPHPDLEKVVGIFVNTLVMRNYPEEKKTFLELLQEVKINALKAYENQDYQFEELVEKLDLRRDLSRNPLFDVMFSMQNENQPKIDFTDFKLRPFYYKNETSKFDLSISATQLDEEINFNFQYDVNLFKRTTIQRIISHFDKILNIVSRDLDIQISNIKMITYEEERLVEQFNGSSTDSPINRVIHEIFEKQVARTPDRISIVYKDQTMTYDELNQKANRLATTLRAQGVKANSIIGLLVDRSPEMIIGILGVLKAGGGYLPISPEYPDNRISYILEDSRAKIVLAQPKYLERINKVTVIDLEKDKTYATGKINLERVNQPQDLAYVLYTSGSTGKPKGVKIEHRSVINTIDHLQSRYPVDKNDLILQSTVYTFDASVREILWWFFNGASCYLLENDWEKDPKRIIETIPQKGITVAKFVPAFLEEILTLSLEIGIEKLGSLKYLLVGGEALTKQLVEKFFKVFSTKDRRPAFVNVYGPSEVTIHCTEYEIKNLIESTFAPIGRPIANNKIYILDDSLQPVPIGIAGEIYIAGVGLARGYLDTQLTEAKFLKNPIVPGERLYKTGDRGRWLEDGNIEFLGRIDHQVKIRGYRIETGEVESEIIRHPQIRKAVVIPRAGENDIYYLCAYLVADTEVTVSELRDYLAQNLPKYMIPSLFVQLEEIPLTSNGKIDRKVLLQSGENLLSGTEYEAPRNFVEEKMVVIWEKILGKSSIGINDNFFELGGHSLKGTRLIGYLHKEFDVEIPLNLLFMNPTIKAISDHVQNAANRGFIQIERSAKKEYYDVSSAQKRMFILNQIDQKTSAYNMPSVLEIEGALSIEEAKRSFKQLVSRHETLRTSFKKIEGQIVQIIQDEVEIEFAFKDLTDTSEDIEEIKRELVEEFVRPFDLSIAPLLRVQIVKYEELRYLLMFDLHHIISDGISMGILVMEFSQIYAGKELDDLRIQYKDFAEWQNNKQNSELITKQKEYWINKFSSDISLLNLPTDYPRPLVKNFAGDNITIKLDQAVGSKLRRLIKETNSTMYVVLLSAVNILLSRYSAQEDIIVGTPIAGRSHPDIDNIVGMFVNTLVMRNYPKGEMTYIEFLKEVKTTALEAYENQDYQFEDLVDQLGLSRTMSRNPLYDVMVVMQNIDRDDIEISDLRFKPYHYENKIAKFDLTVSACEMDEGLLIILEYSTQLFKHESITRMGCHLENILKTLSENIDIELGRIEMVTGEEKDKLLYDFNDTHCDYPENKTLHGLFEEQVAKTPDRVAIIYKDQQLTYLQLNQRANQLARTLRKKGVKPDSIVGIMVNPSIEMSVGIMAILKAGGAYLPIDSEYPEERIEYMLTDSQTDILVTTTELAIKTTFEKEILDLGDHSIYDSYLENLKHVNSGGELAYVIYTSGSTGLPKGVMIEHKSIAQTLMWRLEVYAFTQEVRELIMFSFSFDGFVLSFFTFVVSGACVILLGADERKDPLSIKNSIVKHKVTHLTIGSSLYNTILNIVDKSDLESLEEVSLAGEILPGQTLRKSKQLLPNTIVSNEYGPTENSVVTSLERDLEVSSKITIGKPMDNTQVYILNQNLQLQPIGVPGELCISGGGLARGYLNKPELTKDKFINNPFNIGERLYKSGDFAKWLPDGRIDIIGRIDNQVKIRGYRIEIGEVEKQLLTHELIQHAIVLDKDDEDGQKYLCAYLLISEENNGVKITASDIRNYLLNKIPEYMIPALFVQLDSLPFTPNGKIDVKALPNLEDNIIRSEYEPPRNSTEERLAKMWTEVLGFIKVGIHDGFFELGGNSLKVVKLVDLINQDFDLQLKLVDVFSLATIAQLSAYIQELKNIDEQIIEYQL